MDNNTATVIIVGLICVTIVISKFMVKCVENKKYIYDNITTGKEYRVLEEDEKTYKIINNDDEEAYYMKDCFKPVEPQKEIKEYTVMEIFQEEDRTEFKNSRDIIVYPATIGLNKYLIDKASGTEIRVSLKLLKDKFTLIEEPKPVTTTEAFKALDEGKIIESIVSHAKYFKKDNGKIEYAEITEDENEQAYIGFEELEGQWIIHE